MWYRFAIQKDQESLFSNLKHPFSKTYSAQLTAFNLQRYKTAQENKIMLPPVHDGCKCKIEILPSGAKLWQFSNNCCNFCRQLGIEFNRSQDTELNEPAKLNPSIPEPPAIIPEEEGEEPQIPEKTTENYRYTPRQFFNFSRLNKGRP